MFIRSKEVMGMNTPSVRESLMYLRSSGKRAQLIEELQRGVVPLSKPEMPREKMRDKGPENLTNQELIQVVLGSGTAQHRVQSVAEQVVILLNEEYSGVRTDYESLFKKLTSIRGMGGAKAACIIAALEFAKRMHEKSVRVLKDSNDVLPLLSLLANKKQEYFVCISLNGGNRLISRRVVTIGLVDQALVHPREVFSEALKERAAKIIVAHNHPAGDVSPSSEDIRVTEILAKASTILGLDLLDHIIVAGEKYFSFREEGML